MLDKPVIYFMIGVLVGSVFSFAGKWSYKKGEDATQKTALSAFSVGSRGEDGLFLDAKIKSIWVLTREISLEELKELSNKNPSLSYVNAPFKSVEGSMTLLVEMIENDRN